MGDWDFLYEMRERGYSAEDIADAASCGVAPYEWECIDSDWIDVELSQEHDDDGDAAHSEGAFRSRDGFPYSLVRQGEIFLDLLDCAQRHFENTGRYLQVWGELGEIYAEIKFGLRRHSTHRAGSDGSIAGKLVEVKTISPEKSTDRVLVKSQGDFEQLLIVRISSDFQFKSKMFDRAELKRMRRKMLRGRLAVDD